MSGNLQSIGANPRGLLGRIAGRLMNCVHSRSYRNIIKSILRDIQPAAPLRILDIGCGGGKAIRLFHARVKNARIHGIDISPDMAALARRVNSKAVRVGQVDITQGDVTALPYQDHSFDIVTAFDTVNFWTDPDRAVDEIIRILKENGRFVIVNGYPEEGSKWYEFVRFKDSDAYRDMLTAHGFRSIRITVQRHTIIIEAGK